MVASSAFKELSAVLARLESSGTEVEHAVIDEDLTGSDETLTAELSVGVPMLPGDEASDGVSITAVDAAVEDGRVAVDLTVTVSGEEASADSPTPGDTRGGQSVDDTRSGPAYKDPDALRAVYEQHDTFPAMTDALDVDVTSETVRRHMIKYDIHDPEDTSPRHAPSRKSDRQPSESAGRTTGSDSQFTESARQRTGDSETAESDSATQSDSDSATQSEGVTQSAITDGGNATVAGAAGTQSTSDRTPVAALLADRPGDSRGDFGLPDSVTVGTLTAAINGARTVHELAREIGVDQPTAREFLRTFDLLNFVSHPLAAEQVTVSPDEVRRRLGPAGR